MLWRSRDARSDSRSPFALIHSWRVDEAAVPTRSKRNEANTMNALEAIGERPLAVSFAKAAELTSVSKNSLRRFAKTGRLRTVRLGRRRIIPFAALNELLRNSLDNSSGANTVTEHNTTGALTATLAGTSEEIK